MAAQRYPDAPERQDAYVAACWEPVGTAYAELLATVTIRDNGPLRRSEVRHVAWRHPFTEGGVIRSGEVDSPGAGIGAGPTR